MEEKNQNQKSNEYLRTKKYEKNRKQIKVSLNKNEIKKCNQKFGRLLTGREVKQVLLESKVIIITKNYNPELPILINQIQRIGNNINQFVYIANKQKETVLAEELSRKMNEIKLLLEQINSHENKGN